MEFTRYRFLMLWVFLASTVMGMVPSSSCTDWMMDFKMASSPALPWPYAPQMMVPSRFLAFWRASRFRMLS